MPVEEEEVCRPLLPERFQKVRIFIIGKCRLDRAQIDGVKGGYEAFGFFDVGEEGSTLIMFVECLRYSVMEGLIFKYDEAFEFVELGGV